MSRVTQAIVAVAAIAAVAACASRPKEVAVVVPPPEPPAVPVHVTPPITPINRGLSPAATVWHMRVALNVAALACRGAQEATIVQRYNAMLATHKATLASAQTQLSEQYRAGGGDWQDRYDDAMTRLYNFFSQAQAREAFCTAAAATLAESERLTPGELQTFAAAVLPTLDAPFAEMLAPRPMIALAAPVSVPVVGGAPAAAIPVSRATAVVMQPTAPASVSVARPSPLPAPATSSSAAVPSRSVASGAGVAAAAGTRPANAAAGPNATRLAAAGPSSTANKPAAAVGTRAAPPPAARAPAVARRVPWIEVDAAVLRD
ncbi:hypothetical protein [Sphingomonas sp. IC4-52]|uniref:hypothetical protein n=1 Tax=Sphingomonas sp. IC4-52 TaxID=2887202 RepID=UPI001D111758|nr:hypothetical protein [Sphingomonas sp. IC4-52]MCC2980638.1 hypothetical protein [Sphingomonas sp. IC4-52]